MNSCCSTFGTAVARQFDTSLAEGDLRRYHRRGPSPTTRLLREAIRESGGGQTLLDIGAGVGALSFELLAAGFARATAVDAAPAYLVALRREAGARGLEERVTVVEGDFVTAADSIPNADVVVMDRVVCCYPAFVPLLERALAHSSKAFAYSYPRDRWYIRVAIRVHNLIRALLGNDFRAFAHSVAAMDQLIQRHGFRRTSRAGTFVWAVDVYARVPTGTPA